MPIWLKGVGRSHSELARILSESNGGKETCFRYRRSHARHELGGADGELIYMETRTPCQVLEISAEGCSLQTEKPFRAGALAPVEVVLSTLGMVLHIGGVVQWVKKEHHMGIHFTHVDSGSKHQVEWLIACLLDRRNVESVKQSISSRRLNPSIGDVLAVELPDTRPAPSDVPETQQAKIAYDHLVHGGEGRLHSQEGGEWPAVLQFSTNRIRLTCALVDLSLEAAPFERPDRQAGKSMILSKWVLKSRVSASCSAVWPRPSTMLAPSVSSSSP